MPAETSVNNWETSFEKEVEMLRLASAEGNVAFLAMYQEKTLEAITAEAASAYRDFTAMDMATMYEVSDVYKQMKDKCDTAIKDNEADCTAVNQSMQTLKETKGDAAEEDWEALLNDEVDKQKAESIKRWDDLKKFGVEKIKKMPEQSRATAAKTYSLGLSTVGKLASTVVNWLKDGLNRIYEFFSKAWEKIAEFGKKAGEWVSSAFSTVTGIFSSLFSYSATDLRVQNGQFGQFSAVSADRDSVSGVTLEQAKQFLDCIVQIALQVNLDGAHSAPSLRKARSGLLR